MLNKLVLLTTVLFIGATARLSAASVCPSTANTTTDCDFIITIGASGTAMVADVPGSMPFNSAIILNDGTPEPGGDASLVGVVNDYSSALTSLTLHGSGANAGIFDFSFNGICVYTNAPYCATAASGYEGPTTTFSNLMIGGNFQTSDGTVNFNPGLGTGQTTYFALEDSAADINANGGLMVTGATYASSSVTPEPADLTLVGMGFAALLFWRRKLRSNN